MRTLPPLAALGVLLLASAATSAETAAGALAFAPVSGFERAEGASALAADPVRGRLAVGDARGVWLREADGRVRRALGSGPVHDLTFDAKGVLFAATERGLFEIGLDARVVRRSLGPGGAGRARRVLSTALGTFVASEDGILVATPAAPFRPLDGGLPGGETTALALLPEPGALGRLWAIVGGDLYGVRLDADAGALRTQAFVREPLASQGGAPLELLGGTDAVSLVVLRSSALELRTSSGFESVALGLPPGAAPVRLALGGGRAFIASDAGLLEAPGLAGPWRRAAGAAGGAPASAVVATAERVFVATSRGIFAADFASASRLPATPQARVRGCAASGASVETSSASGEPGIEAVQRAALRYLELGSDRLRRLQRNVARRGFLPELALHGNYGGFRAHDEDRDETVFSSGDRYRLLDRLRERGRDFVVGATLHWDFGDTVYHPEEIDVSKEVRELIELRDEVLDEIDQLYFERKRVLLERAALADSASVEAERLALRARELAAGLDAWTGGWWSRQTEAPSPRETHPMEEAR